MRTRSVLAMGVALLAIMATASQAGDFWGLKQGNPQLKSAGQLAFGPEGILFVGDAKAATVYAIDTGDTSGDPAKAKYQIENLNKKIAQELELSPEQASINDLVVNPASGNLYASIGQGEVAAIVRIEPSGKISPLSLKNVRFSKVELPNAPEDKITGEGRRRGNRRLESITDLAYVDSRVMVSGLSQGESPSTVREIAFPFTESDEGTPIEIYHGAHGRLEDDAVVRTFVPLNIGGEPNLLAGFTCTPLVKFPVPKLESGKKIRGTTVAELGNRNRPLDMIVYQQDGKDYLLIANSARGVMKVSTANIERAEGITEPVRGGGTAGQEYDTVETLKNVVQLDRLNETQAVVLIDNEGSQNVQTIDLP